MAMLDVVDEEDNIIGQASFEECHTKGLRHRGASVLVFRDSSLKEMLIQKRSLHLAADPGKFISSASGHVDSGEGYEEAALREMYEEIFHGMEETRLALRLIVKMSIIDRPMNREFVSLYYTVCPGPFSPQPDEVMKLEFVSVDTLRKDMAANPERYCLGFIEELKEFDRYIKKRKSQIESNPK